MARKGGGEATLVGKFMRLSAKSEETQKANVNRLSNNRYLFATLLTFNKDGSDNCFQLVLNLGVGKAHDMVAAPIEPIGAGSIVSSLNRGSVNVTIYFDDKPSSSAIKINDEGRNDVLPPKFVAVLAVAQGGPELGFGGGEGATKLLGTSQLCGRDAVLFREIRHNFQCLVCPLTPTLSPAGRGSGLDMYPPFPCKGEGPGERVSLITFLASIIESLHIFTKLACWW